MIKIDNLDKSKNISSVKGKTTTVGGSFSSYLNAAGSTESNSVTPTGSISVTDAIFATQMVSGEEERAARRHLCKRGGNLLSKLEEIRDGLLLGYISKDKLIEISRVMRERKFDVNDEKLQQIIAEIELRVEVELAKLTK